jgi:aryl-alcohol dehydrogenase-like predicted oxidoreductase
VILSKCHLKCDDDKTIEDNDYKWINRHGLSRKHIMDAVEASCERLGTYMDVLQIHRMDHDTPTKKSWKLCTTWLKVAK